VTIRPVLSKEAPSRAAAVRGVHEALRQAAELHERKERNKYGR
jgi:hypothetical protein